MFQCKDLLSLTTMSQASVIAGSSGMEKGIRWSYKAENINFEKWVRGNELLIVSAPVTQRKNFDLYQTIKKAIELNMSCALLLMGENYVTQIDEKVIDLAENNDFPLFTMPWNVPLLDFFEELGHAISYLDDRKDIEDSLLAEIIFGNCINTSSIEQKCRQTGNDPRMLEQVFVLHLCKKSSEETCNDLNQGITNDKIRNFAQTLKEYFAECNYPAIISYDEMGFYRMLMSYENTAPMQRFADEVLDPIIQYEKKAHTQLMETMWTYFECDCNLQRTADKLFLHKNTVKYRLQRVEQLTGKSFANRFQSQELYNALMIYYFLE